MSDLIGRIVNELNVDRDTALQGAGAIFSVIKERVGLRTFQMLRVPFPEIEEWIDLHSGIEGYGAGDFFIRDLGFSGPAVDVVERATSSGVPLDVTQRMFAIIYGAIEREAIPAVVEKVRERMPDPSALDPNQKKRIKKWYIK
jgi:hypothetical protein